MSEEQLAKLRNIIRENPGLIWYTKSYDQLSERSVVEAVINYGTWDETQKLIDIMGIKEAARVFAWHDAQKRCNINKLPRNYFRHYFDKYAPEYLNTRAD